MQKSGSTTSQLIEACPYKCIKANPGDTSVIHFGNKGAGHLYDITNADLNTTIHHMVNKTQQETRLLIPDGIHAMGTYFVSLSCHWVVDIPNYGKITPDLPCFKSAQDSIPTIRIVIPSRTLDASLLSRANDVHVEISSSEGYKEVKSIFN